MRYTRTIKDVPERGSITVAQARRAARIAAHQASAKRAPRENGRPKKKATE